MNDAFYTMTGERPDLAGVEAVRPEGFIADMIIPPVSSADKSGTIYYATTNADVAAQTGRAVGAAPTNTQISDSSTTFTCAEAIKRYSITPDEVKQMGGIEKADEIGAKASKRSVFRAIEADVATVVLGGAADDTFDPAKVHTDIQDAFDAMDLYEGETTLVTSTKTAKAMIQGMLSDGTQGNVLARLVAGNTAPLDFAAWMNALKIYFGVEKVLIGNSSIWNSGDNAGKFALTKTNIGDGELEHKAKAVLGKRYQFLPDGENPWIIESVADRLTKNNHYDASNWYDIVTLNSGALYVFGGVLDA